MTSYWREASMALSAAASTLNFATALLAYRTLRATIALNERAAALLSRPASGVIEAASALGRPQEQEIETSLPTSAGSHSCPGCGARESIPSALRAARDEEFEKASLTTSATGAGKAGPATPPSRATDYSGLGRPQAQEIETSLPTSATDHSGLSRPLPETPSRRAPEPTR